MKKNIYILGFLAFIQNSFAQTPWLSRWISPEGSQVYLYGSIHAGAPGHTDLPASAIQALQASRTVVPEVDLKAQIQRLPSGPLLDPNSLKPEHKTGLDQIFGGSQWQSVPGWQILAGLAAREASRSGMQMDYGVDQQVLRQAAKMGKKLRPLESAALQLNLLASMPQNLMTEAVVESLKPDEDAMPSLVQAWQKGDCEPLVAEIEGRKGTSSVELRNWMRTSMLESRNSAMADSLRLWAKNPNESFFVVIGAAHLCGDSSVQKGLLKRGFRRVTVK